MVYTDAERAKLVENVKAIDAYIKESIQPRVHGELEVGFGGTHRCVRSGNTTHMMRLLITSDQIQFAVKFGSYQHFVAGKGDCFNRHLNDITNDVEAMVLIIKNWFDVKCRLNTGVQEQEDTVKAINDFKI